MGLLLSETIPGIEGTFFITQRMEVVGGGEGWGGGFKGGYVYMAQSRAMHSNQLRNRKLYDMSAQLSTNYQDNEKQNTSFSTKSKRMTQKYFSATQLVISCHAARYYPGIPNQTSSRYAGFQIYETRNVLLKDLVPDSLAKNLTDLCTAL